MDVVSRLYCIVLKGNLLLQEAPFRHASPPKSRLQIPSATQCQTQQMGITISTAIQRFSGQLTFPFQPGDWQLLLAFCVNGNTGSLKHVILCAAARLAQNCSEKGLLTAATKAQLMVRASVRWKPATV